MRSVEAKLRTGGTTDGAAGFDRGLAGRYAADDTALIRQAQAGRWEAFLEVASHYDRSILGLALRLTGSEREARNLFQRALVESYRQLRHYRFQCSFYLWIYRNVARTCMEFLGKREAGSPGQLAPLEAALEQLSPRERMVLELKQYLGLKLDTIAAILGTDEASTRSILVRATLALRLELEARSIQ